MKPDLFSTLGWLVIGVLFTIAGDVFLKKSQLHDYKFLALGFLLYVIGAIPVAIVFRTMDFGSVFLVWEALTVMLAMGIAVLYFGEGLTAYKTLALLFALSALYFSYKG